MYTRAKKNAAPLSKERKGVEPSITLTPTERTQIKDMARKHRVSPQASVDELLINPPKYQKTGTPNYSTFFPSTNAQPVVARVSDDSMEQLLQITNTDQIT